MWYNRFLLLAPEVAERRKSAEARKKFEEAGLPALNKMKYYIQAARACQLDLEKKGFIEPIAHGFFVRFAAGRLQQLNGFVFQGLTQMTEGFQAKESFLLLECDGGAQHCLHFA